MIIHKVKVYPSKKFLPKKMQLAWKLAEMASDNSKLHKSVPKFHTLNQLWTDLAKAINESENGLVGIAKANCEVETKLCQGIINE